jgi:trk system potassium uptake protein TrkH
VWQKSTKEIREESTRKPFRPGQILIISFLSVITIGTCLLSLPISTVGPRLSIIDALFTSTSATCVTGLVVCDTGTRLSQFGQVVVLCLFQIGGLGIMSFSTLFVMALGKRITFRNRQVIQASISPVSLGEAVGVLKYVFLYTFVFETAGFLALYFLLEPMMEEQHLWFSSLFHSVSAFCNAGFSLFEDSLVSYKGDILVNFVITTLILAGSMGFLVVLDLNELWKSRDDPKRRLTLHAKITLWVSIVLLLLGSFVIFVLEYGASLKGLSGSEKLLAAYFQSVTPRTAGFNTIAIESLRLPTLFFLVFLMFIGGSPGSTAGGIKTTTFGVLLASLWSILRGRRRIEVFKRTISWDIGQKALAVISLSMLLVFSSTLIMLIVEGDHSLLAILFEVVSAFGTVGLSCGLTPLLSPWGKVIIMLTMFIGRIGPLSLAFAIAKREPSFVYKYPEEDVYVG